MPSVFFDARVARSLASAARNGIHGRQLRGDRCAAESAPRRAELAPSTRPRKGQRDNGWDDARSPRARVHHHPAGQTAQGKHKNSLDYGNSSRVGGFATSVAVLNAMRARLLPEKLASSLNRRCSIPVHFFDPAAP